MTSIYKYKKNMEIINNSMLDEILEIRNSYNYSSYTKDDVINTLNKDRYNIDDLKVLLSPIATDYLELMAHKAQLLTKKQFGNSISLFTPLYISNYCENLCLYCGFNCNNKIDRAKLNYEEIEKEMLAIAKTGLKEILILTGESRKRSSLEYINEAVKIAKKYFTTIGIEIYPLNTEEYELLHESGADFVSVYQETYSESAYDQQHQYGSKRVFPYRFYAQERALMGGIRGVSFGVLLGLDDFRKDALCAASHAYLIQRKYPQAEIGFSVPRLRPFINENSNKNNNAVYERQLLQVMLCYRLFMPYSSITISTRESAEFRDNVISIVANKMSAGVMVGIGGHDIEKKGDEQFEISDDRSVCEILDLIKSRNLQSVLTDTSYL